MGNCHSMIIVDKILMDDRILHNDLLFTSGFSKEALKPFSKGPYAGIRNNYGRFLDEKVSLQTGKWWRCLF